MQCHKNRPSPWHVQLPLPHKSTLLSGRLSPAGLVTAGPYSAMYRVALWWHWEVLFHDLWSQQLKYYWCTWWGIGFFITFCSPRRQVRVSACAHPRVLSSPEDQTHQEKTGFSVVAYCLCWGCEQSLALHKRAKRQPAGNLDLYSSANIYRKRSSFFHFVWD